MKGRIIIEFNSKDKCMSKALREIKKLGYEIVDANPNFKYL